MKTWAVTILLAASPAFSARADDPPTAPSDPVFLAQLAEGPTVEGRVRQLGPGGNLVLDTVNPGQPGARPRTIPLTGVFALTRRGGDPVPSPPLGSVVLFPDGDRLRAIIGIASERELNVLPPSLGDAATPVSLDRLLGLVLAPPSEPAPAARLIARVRNEPRNAELLWLSNGDRLTGSLLDLGASTVKFETDARPLDLPRSSIVAVGFDPALVQYPRPEGVYLELTLADGSRLGVHDVHAEQGQLVATTRFGPPIRVPLATIARIGVRGPHLVDLTETEPAGAEFVGYLGAHPKSFGRNTTWDDKPIRLGGEPVDRGLGILPRTLLAYKLDPRDRRFQATIGLDDRAGQRSSVVFRVLVDGKPRYTSEAVTPRQAPIPIDVDVQGARLLILAVEFGAGGDVQDSAVWADPRLVRDAP